MKLRRGALAWTASPVLAVSVLIAVYGALGGRVHPEPSEAGVAVVASEAAATEAPTPTGTVPPALAVVTAPSPTPTSSPPIATPTATPSPSRVERSGSARVLDRGPATRPFVALTFDAGSDAGYTAQILDVLHAQGVTASFGITGRWAEQNPELLRRIVREGHHLINHTYDHDSLTGLSTNAAPMTRTQRWSELDRTADAVRQIAGVDIGPYFRPPYGDYDASVNADVYARGYDYNVMWTVDSLGWRGISADEIVARCLANAQPGAIYIFHVGSASQDGNALDRIITGLRRGGYGMGSVPQLLGS
ncbi:MAG TPA: polysaccharide deacetylase family protein [Dehalococcoidia bacterium]|nr:polysaccharide deacetylase family protein [Dehalococcoidia bacterium]